MTPTLISDAEVNLLCCKALGWTRHTTPGNTPTWQVPEGTWGAGFTNQTTDGQRRFFVSGTPDFCRSLDEVHHLLVPHLQTPEQRVSFQDHLLEAARVEGELVEPTLEGFWVLNAPARVRARAFLKALGVHP